MASTNYYDFSAENFRNTIYALDLAIETFYSNLIFKGDTNRIIYSDNSNALRKRAGTQAWNNLYLPFMNYKLQKVDINTNRNWWHNITNIEGVWSEELQRKIRLAPIRAVYESTVFYHRNDDNLFGMHELIFDFNNETQLRPTLTVTQDSVDYSLELLAILDYKLDYDPDYTEKDWFSQNRIHSIKLDFEFDY